jgi:hypothetical protein
MKRPRCSGSGAAILVALSMAGCGGAGGASSGAPDTLRDSPPWTAVYWVNSNSGPTFQWSLDGIEAERYVAAALNGEPSGGSGCVPFGGAVTPGVAAQSLHAELSGEAVFEIWMQPRDHEFDGVAEQDLAAAAQAALVSFQACVAQDWPQAPVVSGFLCVKEQQLGGDANCDTLAEVFAQGIHVPGLAANVDYGILAAPGSMNRTDLDAALGEMYEPIYFPPSNTCPDPGNGQAYGSQIGAWIESAAVLPESGSVAVPAFGGPSSTCQLDYDQLAPALAAEVPTGLAGLGLWG